MTHIPDPVGKTDFLRAEFEGAFGKLDSAPRFSKVQHQVRVLSQAQKLLNHDEGAAVLYEYAPRFATAGVFSGGDWSKPENLQPALVRSALTGRSFASVEYLNQLRMLALALGEASNDKVSADHARRFLEDVLARNLDLLFPEASEVTREQADPSLDRVRRLFEFIVSKLGTSGILESLIDEAERVLLQRPIMVDRIETMLRTAQHSLAQEPEPGQEEAYDRAKYLLRAAEAPSYLASLYSEPAAYEQALAKAEPAALAEEARLFGESMDNTGLVCDLHAVLLRFCTNQAPHLLPAALALSAVGKVSLEENSWLIGVVIKHAVTPDTARCIYGLSRMLNMGILFYRPVGPGLQRIIMLPIRPEVGRQLQQASGLAHPPSPNTLLLAGTLSVLGQPRGVDQGHNPTCQSARAISLWAQNDPGYLLELICRAGRDGDIVMHFEGQQIVSTQLDLGLAKTLNTELDPVSLVLTPHIDRIYMEMSRRTIGRGEDGHRWVNPELHGWWVYRKFSALINPVSGAIQQFDEFMRLFHAVYHPLYNGGRDLVYAQPCGVVSTDPNGNFVGYHAVSIQRVSVDPSNQWRVYFFNPNRDKGQNWGQGIQTSTCDNYELEGESSLPFEQFGMRLYVFHYKDKEHGDPAAIPAEAVERIREGVTVSWGQGR